MRNARVQWLLDVIRVAIQAPSQTDQRNKVRTELMRCDVLRANANAFRLQPSSVDFSSCHNVTPSERIPTSLLDVILNHRCSNH